MRRIIVGAFTSLDGVDGVHGGNAAGSNGLLHEAMLTHLRASA